MVKFPIAKCHDCGGLYMDWYWHFWSKRHQKWLKAEYPYAYISIREKMIDERT